ncbi:NlpC/P60 family protein [Paraburkholderia sp. SIMBA_049]
MKTVTRCEFVAEARAWIGTPYRHQGRLKGIGVDCIGLVIGVAREVGLFDLDVGAYDKRPDGTLQMRVEQYTTPKGLDEAQPGDLLLFHWDGMPTHVGILSEPLHLIHAFAVNRKVVEHRLDERWLAQIVGAYQIPGVL